MLKDIRMRRVPIDRIFSNSNVTSISFLNKYKNAFFIGNDDVSLGVGNVICAGNIITCNIKIKKDLNKKNDIYELLYDGDISELKIISIPILKFKKEVLNYKKGENLISYIDFTTNVLEQNIIIASDELTKIYIARGLGINYTE